MTPIDPNYRSSTISPTPTGGRSWTPLRLSPLDQELRISPPPDPIGSPSFVLQGPDGNPEAMASPLKKGPTTPKGGFKTLRRVSISSLGNETPPLAWVKNRGELTPKKKDELTHEASIMNYLYHQGVIGIPKLEYFGEYMNQKNEPKFGMLMHYYNEGTLKDILERQISNPSSLLTQQQQRKIQLNLLETLSDIHANHVIHRDIKPDNIFILKNGEDFEAHIGDFGLAVRTDDMDDFHKRNCVGGTPGYMAPEYKSLLRWKPTLFDNMRVSSSTTPSLDVYAMGITFFVMDQLSNSKDKHIGTIVTKATKEHYYSHLNAENPFDQLVYQMLKPSVKDRITAQAALKQLQKIVAQEITAGPVELVDQPAIKIEMKMLTFIQMELNEREEITTDEVQKIKNLKKVMAIAAHELNEPKATLPQPKAKTSCCAIA